MTASQSDEQRTLTGTLSGSATHEKRTSISLGVSCSEEASGSAEVPTPATAAHSASFDEANSSDFTLGALVADQPNQWCVNGQYKVYLEAKFLNDKGVMTLTLTLERRVLTGSLPTMPGSTISSPDICWSGWCLLLAVIL